MTAQVNDDDNIVHTFSTHTHKKRIPDKDLTCKTSLQRKNYCFGAKVTLLCKGFLWFAILRLGQLTIARRNTQCSIRTTHSFCLPHMHWRMAIHFSYVRFFFFFNFANFSYRMSVRLFYYCNIILLHPFYPSHFRLWYFLLTPYILQWNIFS